MGELTTPKAIHKNHKEPPCVPTFDAVMGLIDLAKFHIVDCFDPYEYRPTLHFETNCIEIKFNRIVQIAHSFCVLSVTRRFID